MQFLNGYAFLPSSHGPRDWGSLVWGYCAIPNSPFLHWLRRCSCDKPYQLSMFVFDDEFSTGQVSSQYLGSWLRKHLHICTASRFSSVFGKGCPRTECYVHNPKYKNGVHSKEFWRQSFGAFTDFRIHDDICNGIQNRDSQIQVAYS